RFYFTGGEFYDPRWSPEGTRLAYTARQSVGGANRDLFIGQVSFDHAPQFPIGIADCLAYRHKPFGMLLTATDSDNEAVTYSAPAAFLPSGSSFSPSTHSFSWVDPGPVCSENYVVFRAVDGSDGVASRVIKITTVIDTVG